MDPNKLTESTQSALHAAQTKALRYGHTEVDTEHLLLALLEQQDGLIGRLIDRAGGDARSLGAALDAELQRRPRVSGPGAPAGQIAVSRALAELLDRAEREAER